MRPVRVLFLCTGNSARSLMAEALLREMGGAEFEAFSAGTHPKGINPHTERVLQDEGIATSCLRSKSIDEFEGARFDYLITVCDAAAEECPIFPGATRRLHWSFADPAAVPGTDEEKLAAFKGTLDGMRRQMRGFVRKVAAERKKRSAAGILGQEERR